LGAYESARPKNLLFDRLKSSKIGRRGSARLAFFFQSRKNQKRVFE
jgi:hypothetical protein